MTLRPTSPGLGVWLNLPWTMKMVFGELVNRVPIFGSPRRAYMLIGAASTACGMLIPRRRGRRLDHVHPVLITLPARRDADRHRHR